MPEVSFLDLFDRLVSERQIPILESTQVASGNICIICENLHLGLGSLFQSVEGLNTFIGSPVSDHTNSV